MLFSQTENRNPCASKVGRSDEVRQPVRLATCVLVACGAAAPVAVTPKTKAPAPVAEIVPGTFWEETPIASVALPPAVYEKEKLVRAELAPRIDALPQASRENCWKAACS